MNMNMNRKGINASTEIAKTIIADCFDRLQMGYPFSPIITSFNNNVEFKKITLLFEIVKIAALQDGKAVSMNIANYGITDKAQLFELAKIVAAQDGGAISKSIATYGITDPIHLFEIAKIAAAQDSLGTSAFIANYGIQNPNHLFEIAKIAAAHDGYAISLLIGNYNITDPIDRFEIAKQAAAQNGGEVSKLIDNYKITNSIHLCDIAKIAVSQNEPQTSEYFANYHITNPAYRIEIAMISAEKHDWILSDEFFSNYSLADPRLRFEIVKIAAKNNGYETSKHFHNYGITDPNHRFEIAKIAAANSGYGVFAHIANYSITDPTQRYEVARIAASNNGWAASLYVGSFCIMDPSLRFEIAKIAAANNGTETARMIENYNITGLTHRLEIAKIITAQIIASKDFAQIETVITKCLGCPWNHPDLLGQFSALHLLTERELNRAEIEHYMKNSPYYKSMSPIIDEIYKQNAFTRKPLFYCLGLFLLACTCQNISPKAVNEGLPIIEDLLAFKEPEYRLTLVGYVIKTLSKRNAIDSWARLFYLTENKSFTPLICMLLAPLLNEQNMQRIANLIKTRTFQEVNVRNPFIKNLEKLASETSYTLEDKKLILNNLMFPPGCTKDSLCRNAQNIAILLVLGEASTMKTTTQGLDLVLNRVLKAHLGLEGIENLIEKFERTFWSFRQHDAIFRYTALLTTLESLNERQEHLKSLREFIINVLENTFSRNRYSIDDNLHLRTIFNTSEGARLKDLWANDTIYDNAFTSDIVCRQQERIFDSVDFFSSKILNEGHLEEATYPELFSVLRDPSKRSDVKTILEKQLRAEDSSSEGKLKKKINSFQLQTIKLMYPESPLSNKELLEKIKYINNILNNICHQMLIGDLPQLSQDLEIIIRSLSSPQATRQVSQYDGWMVKDTDDPCDLLLLGTEVLSCQNIDGNASLAKCLLSYLLDGKNRALVVKNGAGKIVARAILRLLWDDRTKKPILFQEKIYPEVLDKTIETAINKACQQRAKVLNLPLLSATPTNSPYPNPVHSLGGKAPSEYVDAGPKLTTNTWSLINMYYADPIEQPPARLHIN